MFGALRINPFRHNSLNPRPCNHGCSYRAFIAAQFLNYAISGMQFPHFDRIATYLASFFYSRSIACYSILLPNTQRVINSTTQSTPKMTLIARNSSENAGGATQLHLFHVTLSTTIKFLWSFRKEKHQTASRSRRHIIVRDDNFAPPCFITETTLLWSSS